MRFRSRFGLVQGLLYMVPALTYAYGWTFSGRHKSTDGVFAVLWAIATLLWLSMPLFTYWDFESSGLRERRGLKIKAIPWSDVTYIGPWESRSSNRIAIEYERKGPLSDRGRIIATPFRRQAFLSALREFAPHAEFEV